MFTAMRIHSRAEWGAKPPKSRLTKMRLPVGEVWLHHSVTPVTDDPYRDARFIQQVAFGRGFADISYSYLFHPNGTVLEGRGLYVGAHTAGRNSISLGFCLIGNYDTTVPTAGQIDGVRWCAHHLIEQKALRPGTYPTGGHRNLQSTACPGAHAFQRLGEFRVPWVQPPPPVSPPATPEEGVVPVNRPPIAIMSHPNGYWEVTDDGGVFSFKYPDAGDVPFYGSMGGTALNAPIVDAAPTKDHGGYWLVGADGGVYTFGNAKFHGSLGGIALNRPIKAITVAADGLGYGLMATDGGVFAFGSFKYAGRVEYVG